MRRPGILRIFLASAAILAVSGLFFTSAFPGVAATADELKERIDSRSDELKRIREEQEKLAGEIEENVGEQQSLAKEVKRIGYNINQLDLGIRSGEVAVSKLELEIESLGLQIEDAQGQIIEKKEAVGELIKAIHQTEADTPLIVFLRNQTLSDGFGELQSLSSFTSELAATLAALDQSKLDLENGLASTQNKRAEKSVEQQGLVARKSILGQQNEYKKTLLASTKNQERAYRTMLEDLEKQQEAIAEEVDRLEEELRLQIDPSMLPGARPGVLGWPAQGRLSQGYGATTFAKYHYKSRWHNGIDVAAPIGTPLYAADDGLVVEIWDQDKYCRRGAYGKFVVLRHPNNLTTMYAHLSAFLPSLEVGDTVKRGEVIGYMGSSGNSTGSHVHFVVYSTATFHTEPSSLNCGPKMPFGGDLNPMDYLAPQF